METNSKIDENKVDKIKLEIGETNFDKEDLRILFDELKNIAIEQFENLGQATIIPSASSKYRLAKFKNGPELFLDTISLNKGLLTFAAAWHFKINDLVSYQNSNKNLDNKVENILLKFTDKIKEMNQIAYEIKIVLDYGQVFNLVEYWHYERTHQAALVCYSNVPDWSTKLIHPDNTFRIFDNPEDIKIWKNLKGNPNWSIDQINIMNHISENAVHGNLYNICDRLHKSPTVEEVSTQISDQDYRFLFVWH